MGGLRGQLALQVLAIQQKHPGAFLKILDFLVRRTGSHAGGHIQEVKLNSFDDELYCLLVVAQTVFIEANIRRHQVVASQSLRCNPRVSNRAPYHAIGAGELGEGFACLWAHVKEQILNCVMLSLAQTVLIRCVPEDVILASEIALMNPGLLQDLEQVVEAVGLRASHHRCECHFSVAGEAHVTYTMLQQYAPIVGQ